ncbi:hypothetical protein EMIHUDRAFT_201923 [Emiliania huxleyi CCMP1516]|uniref:ATP-dependent DNA ligase family profile domain-containing protein n=2 Tax=Emiliania huxleyi TaxID=2903 RepID=A0A0D3KEQ8_EMIH1|nr:hypothetical protein EMIHUDRAFT_201923 [Emiliania huxleyi CCMP1516]EOD34243.1 hypothetical protein EMIHUDRAFT_201923 [Emiliania huxleyi CCMP1516]|eukprot:XP_005786672.1 hypothetical protein EMIHUDRAFT_201923 [Emiliania huxleyi CCMP1516]
MALAAGDVVRIFGLTSERGQELNGREATVETVGERCTLRLETGGEPSDKRLAVPERNLVRAGEYDSDDGCCFLNGSFVAASSGGSSSSFECTLDSSWAAGDLVRQRVKFIGPQRTGSYGTAVRWDAQAAKYAVNLEPTYRGVTIYETPCNLEAADSTVSQAHKQDQRWKVEKAREERCGIFALAVALRPGVDNLRGFVAMEKFDGFRSLWDGTEFRMRGIQGGAERRVKPPPELASLLPTDLKLDGELWSGRGCFSAVSKVWSDFDGVSFAVYDAPEVAGGFLARLAAADEAIAAVARSRGLEPTPPFAPARAPPAARCFVVGAVRCEEEAVVKRLMEAVLAEGGEGLVLRRALSRHRRGRSRDVLKVKEWLDAEAEVLGTNMGDGTSVRASLRLKVIGNSSDCRVTPGTVFSCSWDWKAKPIPSGTTVTFAAPLGDGKPRFPGIIGIGEEYGRELQRARAAARAASAAGGSGEHGAGGAAVDNLWR